jgi:hypothetical protein
VSAPGCPVFTGLIRSLQHTNSTAGLTRAGGSSRAFWRPGNANWYLSVDPHTSLAADPHAYLNEVPI